MNRRNRALAKARWDPAVGNFSKYMRWGPIDWRRPRQFLAPMGKGASAAIIRNMECDHDWKRMHRTRRSRVMLSTTRRDAVGRAAKRRIRDTRRHQRCINCGWSRLHPRYVTPISELLKRTDVFEVQGGDS